jgi:signal transduction histidine kinase/DNA-binding response OmpR family regulator
VPENIRRFLPKIKNLITQPLYAQTLVVALAFVLMVVLSYRFMSDIEHEHMLRDAGYAISNTQARIKADLLEPETFLGGMSETLRLMIMRGDSYDMLTRYITNINEYMDANSQTMTFATAAYCYFDVFDGRLYVNDSWTPPEGYVAQERPWYKKAVEADGKIGVTDPYHNRIADIDVLTFVRRIFDDDGRPLGIVCLDMSLERIKVYAVESYVTDNGYGILLDGNFNVIAHPHPAYLGKSLDKMNDGPAIEEELRQGKNIVERPAVDYKGNPSVLFINRLDNGWYLAILTYAKQYYATVKRIARILIVLGTVLALIVCVILIRIITEKYKSDARIQVMLDAMPMGATFWNKNCNIIDCNQEVIRMFGLSGKKEYLDNFFALSPVYQDGGAPSTPLAIEKINEAFKEGYTRFEWMHQKLNGEPVPCEITLVRVEHRKENVVLGYTRDLREQKALLREINNKNDELKKLVHWYEAILDTIPFPLSVTDVNMNWTFINKATENILNITRSNSIGKQCSDWNVNICNTDKCGIACVKRGIKRTYFSHEGASFQIDVEILTDLDGKPDGFIEIVQDITKLEQITKRQFEAEAANRAKSAFLARISHEIRTPMNAILSISEIQLQKESLPPEMEEALGKIYNSGYLLLGIINDILDLSKIEAEKLELTPVQYDVASLINDAIHLNIVRYDSKPIEFKLQADENIPSTLFGDELRIKQILNNLLSNAFKYTDAGEIAMSVESETQGEQVTLAFRISDTGQGMTTEQVDKLFDEYTRFNNEANRTTEGTGLGMTITRHLVRMMKGDISVKSEKGKGSVFTVRLPQGKVDDGTLGAEAVESLKQFRLGKLSHLRRTPQIVRDYMPYGKVLVVDDVETNLYVAKGLLAPYGLLVETALSGFETIERIENGAVYDVVFMDHFMPKMDGIEAVQKIRALGYSLPVIALTANAMTGQAEMFQKNGFDGFISKPIDIRQLNASLNQLVRDKHPATEVEAARRLKNGLEKMYAAHGGAVQHSAADLAETFIRDAEKSAAAMERVLNKGDTVNDDDMQGYINAVHSLNTALAGIGEDALAESASALERAGMGRDIAAITEKSALFLDELRAAFNKIRPKREKSGGEKIDRAFLGEQLRAILAACAANDQKSAKTAIIALNKKTWPRHVKDQLISITEYLMKGDFAAITAAVKKLENT